MLEVQANSVAHEARRLRLPQLDGRAVLHVGCGEGDICGYARARGASAVLGVDHDPQVLSRARARYADVAFGLAYWHEFLPTRRYDVVLLKFSLGPALEAVVARAMSLLTVNGLLILSAAKNCGWDEAIANAGHDGRPARAKLSELLAAYQYAILSDDAESAIVHCRNHKPLALIVGGRGVAEDALLAQAWYWPGRVGVFNEHTAWRALLASPVGARLVHGLETPDADAGEIISALFDRGLATIMVEQWFARAPPAIIVLDGFIGEGYLKDVCRALESIGYLVWTAQPHGSASSSAAKRQTVAVAGEPLTLAPSQLGGAVDCISFSDDALAISGWAMDKGRQIPVSKFVVHYQDLDLQILEMDNSERPDVADHGLCLPGQTCGFHLKVRVPPQYMGSGTFVPGAVQVYGLLEQHRVALI